MITRQTIRDVQLILLLTVSERKNIKTCRQMNFVFVPFSAENGFFISLNDIMADFRSAYCGWVFRKSSAIMLVRV